MFWRIAEQIHPARSRWRNLALVIEPENAGFIVCDVIVRVRKNAILGRWKQALHARRMHSFWGVPWKDRS